MCSGRCHRYRSTTVGNTVSVPFIGSRHVDRSIQINGQRAVNWYPSLSGDGAKTVLSLVPTEGLDKRAEFGNGICRSVELTLFQGALYWVNGTDLMKMTTSEVVTSVGTLSTSSGLCYAAAGQDYLFVVDGTNGYAWDGSSFTTVNNSTDSDFPTDPSHVGFIDGFFIVLSASSDVWQKSAQEDPTAWAALDFATAEAEPDNAVAVESSYRDLYIIGTITTQVYYNSGNPDFPFELYANGVLEFGTPAPASVARAGGNIFMLAQHKSGGLTVLRVNGFQAQRIADTDTADYLDGLTAAQVATAEAFAYTRSDQTFYELTLPDDDITLVYHLEQNDWHERRSGTDVTGRHRARGHGFFNNEHYVGDYANAKMYVLDPTKRTEDGAAIRRERIMGALHRDGLQIECNRFEVEFVRGVGLLSGQGSDPQAMMTYSNDGGRTWSNEIWRSMGKIGEFTRRAEWHRLGQANDYRFRLVVTDPVDATVISSYGDFEVLAA